MLKKEQLRQVLHRNLQQIAQPQHNDSLLYEEYQQLKGRYERAYEKKLQELNKSKQEISDLSTTTKTFANNTEKSELWKRSHSQHVRQIVSFQPAAHRNSLPKLRIAQTPLKKVFIRKEFYLTQKIEPFIYNASQLQEDSHLSARLPKPMQ